MIKKKIMCFLGLRKEPKKLHHHHHSGRDSNGFAFQAAPFVPQTRREWQQCGSRSLAPGHNGILNAN